jgi:hypothetical protein
MQFEQHKQKAVAEAERSVEAAKEAAEARSGEEKKVLTEVAQAEEERRVQVETSRRSNCTTTH